MPDAMEDRWHLLLLMTRLLTGDPVLTFKKAIAFISNGSLTPDKATQEALIRAKRIDGKAIAEKVRAEVAQ
ncbi:MAG: hypothetical protein HOL45_02005, partial [Chloroflexi bacterium]|nr:hypothetical protein [Chloroflexota bacterium]